MYRQIVANQIVLTDEMHLGRTNRGPKPSHACREDAALVKYAMSIQLINVVSPALEALFDPFEVLDLHVFSRAACTQTYMDRFTQPKPFRTAYRMGAAITTVGLSVLYAPILWFSPLIGVLALLVQYAADQYIILRHSTRPRAFQVEAFTAANYLLRLLPLAQTLLCGVWYFDYDRLLQKLGSQIYAPIITAVIIWCVMTALPVINSLRDWELAKLPRERRPKCDPGDSCCFHPHHPAVHVMRIFACQQQTSTGGSNHQLDEHVMHHGFKMADASVRPV